MRRVLLWLFFLIIFFLTGGGYFKLEVLLILQQQQRAEPQICVGAEVKERREADVVPGREEGAGASLGASSGKLPLGCSPRVEIISPIVRFLVNGRLEWMRSDAFIWPFDGDPLNCCQAARLSRRGWESQVVAGGWMGRARRGEGARDERGCCCLSLIVPARQATRVRENTSATCVQKPQLARRRGDISSTHVYVISGAETCSRSVREGVGELQWEEAGKGERGD